MKSKAGVALCAQPIMDQNNAAYMYVVYIFNHRLNTNILYPIRQCKNVLINVTKMFVLQKASSKKIYEYEHRTPNGGRSDGPHTMQCGGGGWWS